MYFHWWYKSTYSEQCKGEKDIERGLIPVVGFKGVDEFEELNASVVNTSIPVCLKGALQLLSIYCANLIDPQLQECITSAPHILQHFVTEH